MSAARDQLANVTAHKTEATEEVTLRQTDHSVLQALCFDPFCFPELKWGSRPPGQEVGCGLIVLICVFGTRVVRKKAEDIVAGRSSWIGHCNMLQQLP